jgi:hypothetical protein
MLTHHTGSETQERLLTQSSGDVYLWWTTSTSRTCSSGILSTYAYTASCTLTYGTSHTRTRSARADTTHPTATRGTHRLLSHHHRALLLLLLLLLLLIMMLLLLLRLKAHVQIHTHAHLLKALLLSGGCGCSSGRVGGHGSVG